MWFAGHGENGGGKWPLSEGVELIIASMYAKLSGKLETSMYIDYAQRLLALLAAYIVCMYQK